MATSPIPKWELVAVFHRRTWATYCNFARKRYTATESWLKSKRRLEPLHTRFRTQRDLYRDGATGEQ